MCLNSNCLVLFFCQRRAGKQVHLSINTGVKQQRLQEKDVRVEIGLKKGARGVPFFVSEDQYGVPGVQPLIVYRAIFRRNF